MIVVKRSSERAEKQFSFSLNEIVFSEVLAFFVETTFVTFYPSVSTNLIRNKSLLFNNFSNPMPQDGYFT